MSLSRFIEAQARVWPAPLDELRAGCKTTHWMWFVFPQLRGLGRSAAAEHYGIADLDEARAYLADDLLGARLKEACAALLMHRHTPARAILGPIDVLKVRSSATLFRAAGGGPVFGDVLKAFYGGAPCAVTLKMLGDG